MTSRRLPAGHQEGAKDVFGCRIGVDTFAKPEEADSRYLCVDKSGKVILYSNALGTRTDLATLPQDFNLDETPNLQCLANGLYLIKNKADQEYVIDLKLPARTPGRNWPLIGAAVAMVALFALGLWVVRSRSAS